MSLPVVIAIAGALAVAAGAAFQERAVVRAPRLGQLRLLSFLVRSRGWCLGTLLTVAGVVAHMVALSGAPLIIVQPIGVSGLLFAVMLSAFFRRQRLKKAQVIGSLAVTAALAGLLATLPDHAGAPVPTRAETFLMPLGCAGVMLACLAAARFTGPVTRAWTLALAGGVAYGATSAFARVIGSAAVADVLAIVQPLSLVGLAIGLSGAMIVQNAYRSGHFALAYATLLISDPLSAAVIGVVLFDERIPTGPVEGTIAVGAAVLLVVGVVTLARASRPAPAPPVQGTARLGKGGIGEPVGGSTAPAPSGTGSDQHVAADDERPAEGAHRRRDPSARPLRSAGGTAGAAAHRSERGRNPGAGRGRGLSAEPAVE
ncbi:DMT family transporter [Streptomonospora wellingtoniae]|uniref:DMT family transporter n=1 Tax=Streptomonospora wellingtoniae TaxID=3075544 RepID=A0ABU2KYX2_9ACTN|nr:DMT family transporter [Streptomonospora sp. DSM 45055]MDT0304406.1 DMT family transporter [Streptomonospora sp. DSM 45055]